MTDSSEYRELGMGRPIARRDFLNGVAIGIAGACMVLKGVDLEAAQVPSDQASASPDAAASYPPLRSGLRGNYPAAIAEFNSIREGKYTHFPVADSEIQEEYDLVVV